MAKRPKYGGRRAGTPNKATREIKDLARTHAPAARMAKSGNIKGIDWPADKVERWRDIPGHEGYQASDAGRVRSLDKVTRDGRQIRGRVLRTWMAGDGYPYVSLGRGTKTGVHRLVLFAFVGPQPEGHEAAHEDGDSSNARLDNLAWKTKAENEADKRRHGTWRRHGLKGSNHHRAKLSEADITAIRAAAKPGNGEALAAVFGVDRSTIRRVARGEAWRHVA